MLIKEFTRWRDYKSYFVIVALVVILLLITLFITNRRIRQLDEHKPRLGASDNREFFIGPAFHTHFNTIKNE